MSKWLGSSPAVSERWRINRTTLLPEKVRVLPVSDDYLLVEGEEHTQWKGWFFDTVDEAYAHELADVERSLRYATDRKERLERFRMQAKA